jgi:O-antigen/teichoic acid export membrane protein
MDTVDNKTHSIKYNALMNVILTASSFLYPLITFPYVSRVLLVAGNGKVNFAASVANYFMMVASLGIPTYGVRACAQVRDNKDELSKTAQEILIINLIATVLVSITYIICIFTVPRFSQDKVLLFIEGINIVLNMFGANWLYQALEKYDYITVRSIIFKAISVVLMFMFVHKASDYRIYAFTFVFANVGSNVLNFLRLRRYISFKKFSNYNLKKHLGPIFILFAQNVTVSIYTNLDTVMLGFMRDDTQVGLYTAAVKFKGLLTGVVVSLGNVLLPRMSFYVKNNLKSEFEKLMASALNTIFFLAFPIVVYFVLASRDCILFIAGGQYLGAVLAMQIITLAVLPNGLTGIIGVQILTPLNREKQVLYSVIIGASSDFVLNLIMIPFWGATGAALATTVAEFLVLIAQMILGRDVLSAVSGKLQFLHYFLFSIIAGLPTFFVFKMLKYPSIIRLMITFAIYLIVYCLLLYIYKDPILFKALDNKITKRFIRRS